MASRRIVVLLYLVHYAWSQFIDPKGPPIYIGNVSTPTPPPPPPLENWRSKLAPYAIMNDGLSMPMIAFGTGRGTAKVGDTLELVRQSVYWAIEAGYRHIDTAAIYGDEKAVGEAIAEAIENGLVTRNDLFVTTKLWNDQHEERQVIPALKKSLKRLNLTYVDLYLIHFPVSLTLDGKVSDVYYLDTWRGMEMTVMAGLARSIGVSNFNETQLTDIFMHATIKPAVNQIEVNPTMTQEFLVDFCQRLGMLVMAYSPLGFMVSRRQGDTPPPRIDEPELVRIANKYNKTTTQIVLRTAVERGLVPIPKSTTLARIIENLDIFDFYMTETEIANVNSFNKNMRIIYPADWKESIYFPFEQQEF